MIFFFKAGQQNLAFLCFYLQFLEQCFKKSCSFMGKGGNEMPIEGLALTLTNLPPECGGLDSRLRLAQLAG